MQHFGHTLSLSVFALGILYLQHVTHVDTDKWHSQIEKERRFFTFEKNKNPDPTQARSFMQQMAQTNLQSHIASGPIGWKFGS